MWFLLAIAFASGILYLNTLQNGYVLDDKGIITANKFTTRGFSGIPDLLTSSYWEGIGINVRSYRPLSPVTFAVEVGLFGLSAKASHAGNLLLYAMTGLLLFGFLEKLFRRIDPAAPAVLPFLVTLLFLAHPVHTEVVANIKGRDSMLEFFFLVLSGYFLFAYLEQGRTRDLAVSVTAFFPALLSKESALAFLVMVPVILILFDGRSLAKKALTVAYYLMPAAVFLLLYFRYSNVGQFTALHVLDNALLAASSPAELLATKFLILGKYIGLLLFPHPLRYDYSYQTIAFAGFADPAAWISFLAYAGAAVLLVYVLIVRLKGGKTSPWQLLAAFSAAWFFMGLAASSNLFMLIGSTLGERFLYVPSLGFLLVAVWVAYRLALKTGKRKMLTGTPAIVLYSICGLLFTAYLVKTIHRNKAWKDDFTLYSTDLKYLGRNVKANDFLANAYRELGDKSDDAARRREYYLKAIVLKEKAVAIYPKVSEIQRQLGDLYGNTGQMQKAIGAYREAIALNPGDVISHLQTGKAYGMMQQHAEGLKWLKKAEELGPDNPDVLLALGIAYAQLGDLTQAITYFEKTLARDPSNPMAAQYLTQAKKQTGKN